MTIECTSDEGLCSGIPYLFDTIIGGPFSAPMYMFAMGIGICYARKNSPAAHFVKGVQRFFLAYLLNICRFLIPYLIGYAMTKDYTEYMESLLYQVLGNDIFTFAGLAMMIIALFIKLRLSNAVMLMIATVLCALGTLFNGIDAGSPLANIFLGYLIGTEDAAGMVLSYFPVLNWLIFPVAGYVFGNVLKQVKDKDLFYLSFSLPAAILSAVYFAYGISHERGMFGEGQNCYYHMIFSDVLASLCLTIGMLGVCYLIFKYLPPKLFAVAQNISKNVTEIYFIHWVIISFAVNLLMYIVRGTTLLPPGQILILSTVISIASIMIADAWIKRTERRKLHEKAA